MLSIQKEHVAGIIAHAREEAPNECCGILAGDGEVTSHLYRITNTARSPYRYLMEPQEQLNAMLDSERNGWELQAFYHSHTHSPAYPSQTDVRMALQSGWLDVYYVLVTLMDQSNPEIRAFHITESGEVVESEYRVV